MRWVVALTVLLWPVAAPAEGLTEAEAADFVGQVAKCWTIAGLSQVAQTTVVTVRFSLDQDGRPKRDSFALIGAGKDTRQPVKDAYAAARRAVLRCGAKGFKLPLEKYAQWKDIEMTFNPERMPEQ